MNVCFSTLKKKATWELGYHSSPFSTDFFAKKKKFEHSIWLRCYPRPWDMRMNQRHGSGFWYLFFPFLTPHSLWNSRTLESQRALQERRTGVKVLDGAKWPPVHSQSIDNFFTNQAFWGCLGESSQHYPSLQEGNFPRNGGCRASISYPVPRFIFKPP